MDEDYQILSALGSLLPQAPTATKNASAQATLIAKILSILDDPQFQMMSGSSPSSQQMPISTPVVDSYLKGKNETLRMAVQGIVSGEYSPQDAVALIMEDQTLSSYYNPASGGDISYWNSQMKAVIDELSQAQEAAAKAQANDPYMKMGIANREATYGLQSDPQNNVYQVPMDQQFVGGLAGQLSNYEAYAPQQPNQPQGLQGPTGDANLDPLSYRGRPQKGSPPKTYKDPFQNLKQVQDPSLNAANQGNLRALLALYANQQLANANAAGRTPFNDQYDQRVGSALGMVGLK